MDPDLANNDQMTIFVNHKVFDYDNNYLGATGIGLGIKSMQELIQKYQNKYNRNIFFVRMEGDIVISNSFAGGNYKNIREMGQLSENAEDILSRDNTITNYISEDGRIGHLNVRFIPELKWYLFVEQREEASIAGINRTLRINLFILVFVGIIVILLINFTVNNYRGRIDRQNSELKNTNAELSRALKEVKTLSGLLPICASCKNIRDDKGYWNSMEQYVSER